MVKLFREFASDLAFGARHWRKNPGLTILCVSVLAIGVGATTASFTILYDAILKSLPYRDPSHLVLVHGYVSGPDSMYLNSRPGLFSHSALFYFSDLAMTGAGAAEHVDAVDASASLFPMLGMPPELGRTFTPEEDRYKAPRVAILSDALWKGAFAGSRKVLGKSVELDGHPCRVIGVMPADFNFPYRATEMWVPLALPPSRLAPAARSSRWLHMIARLAPGVTAERAGAMLSSLSRGYAARYPAAYPAKAGWRFSIEPLAAWQSRGEESWFFLAFGAAGCLLLIACVNVSGLLLVRATVRQREWAVRAALGAGRARLVRQVFTETGLLVFAGGLAGFLLALVLLRVGQLLDPTHHVIANLLAPVYHTHIGVWTFVSALGVSLVAAMLSGVLPAISVLRSPVERTLHSSSTRTATRGSSWRDILVAGQIGAAIVLLFLAVSLSRSLVKLLEVSPGFFPAHLWTGAIQLPPDRYRSGSPAAAAFFEELLRRVSALPGVQSASAGTSLPFSSGGWTAEFDFPDRPKPAIPPSARMNGVLPGYFGTLRIPLRRGRTFTSQDLSGSTPVAIVNQAFVEKYFPRRNPLGRLIRYRGLRQIVGVVGDVSNGNLAQRPKPEMYFLDFSSGTFLMARTEGNLDITRAVRGALKGVDSSVPLFHVETMTERIEDTVRLRRFVAGLVNAFAFVGFFLAGLGIYGTLAHLVELRRREIAIRMALGASAGHAQALILRQGAVLSFAGLAPGVLVAWACAQALRTLLFGVSPLDPWSICLTLCGFFLLTLVASWVPAVEATRVRALQALREQ